MWRIFFFQSEREGSGTFAATCDVGELAASDFRNTTDTSRPRLLWIKQSHWLSATADAAKPNQRRIAMSHAVMGGHDTPGGRLTFFGRTMSRSVFGGIALALGIVGLAIADKHPAAELYLDPIAQIALGIALIIFGAGLTTSYMRLASVIESATGTGATVTGATADMFVGGAVLILGMLALLHVAPTALVPVQVILVGIGILFNSGASVRAIMLEASVSDDRSMARRLSEELVFETAAVRAIAGLAVAILGILSLSGGDALSLTLSAAIVGGAALLLDSATLSNRLVGVGASPTRTA
jgi:hypothetical protein